MGGSDAPGGQSPATAGNGTGGSAPSIPGEAATGGLTAASAGSATGGASAASGGSEAGGERGGEDEPHSTEPRVARWTAPSESKPTRLGAWQLEVDGGPPFKLGPELWDTREKVFCKFVPAEDGLLRCLPEVPKSYSSSDTYADAECQQDITWVYEGDGRVPPVRPWARPLERVGCEPTRYRALRPIPADSPLYRADVNGRCAPVTDPPPETPQLMLVADTPERWERGNESDGLRISERLSTVDIATTDGGRFVNSLVDARWDVSCALGFRRPDNVIECYPPTAPTGGSLFGDDTCAADLALVRSCEKPAFIEKGINTAVVRFEFGALFTGTVYKRYVKGSPCMAEGTAPSATQIGNHFYSLGAELGPEAVAAVQDGIAGNGRFRARVLLGEDDAAVPIAMGMLPSQRPPYFDSEANEDCRPVWTPDGAVRCIPLSVSLVSLIYFSDPGCTQPALACNDAADCSTRKIVLTRADVHGRAVANGTFSNGTPLAETDLYSGAPGTSCRQVGSKVTGHWALSGSLSLDTFPSLRERHPIAITMP